MTRSNSVKAPNEEHASYMLYVVTVGIVIVAFVVSLSGCVCLSVCPSG